MPFFRQTVLILFALVLGGETIVAASVREDRDYAAAAGAFQGGLYDRAAAAFAQFVEKYPNSGHAAEAVLLQAQAEMKQGKFAEAIALLDNADNLAQAGKRADEFVYWTGEAQFESTNYLDAAETWIAFSQKYPESRLQLPATVGAASALTKLLEWQQVVALLDEAGGAFQRAAQKNPGDEQVARGKLLLAQAKFELKDFGGASAILEPLLEAKTLKRELARQCALLLYQVKIATGETDAALAATTNLLQIARLEKNSDWIAEGTDLRAGALKKLGRGNEALAAYQENLATNAPAEWQHAAVLNIAELAIAQNQFAVATNALGKFLAQFPGSPSADIACLTLAELQLKDYVAQPPATNQLSEIQAQFTRFISTFTNSPLLGKAYLDRGWCQVLAENTSGSFDDFKNAAQKIAALRLPPSEDLLVAWFKMGDAQFAQKDFAGALENYRAVLDSLKLFPETGAPLGGRALYQSLRASLEMNDAAGAGDAFGQILQKHPGDALAQSSSLLYGESMATPGAARAVFEKLSAQLPRSPLQPQIALAVARTYEREQNWQAAITNYENWLKNFPANDFRPQASYALAQADFQAGYETNALGQFTNFVAQFPTNDLAPFAQWWVADHFFRAGDFQDAERNYKYIFQNTNWQASPPGNRTNLFYPAQMMAGRAALARSGYPDAIGYFTGLTADTNCPPDLALSASFAYGSTLMLMPPAGTNSPLANFQKATDVLGQIAQANLTNEPGALAWFYLGDCYLQLTNYDAATNAYAQIFNSPSANISARSRAKIGFGAALEKMAALTMSTDLTNLLNQALDSYRDVSDENEYNKNHGLPFDSFWWEKAYLQGALLAGILYDAERQRNFYVDMEKNLPQLKNLAEQKIASLPPQKN